MILVETKVSYDRRAPDAKEANAKSAMLRSYIYTHTMMWGSDGLRVLPQTLWSEFAETVDRFIQNLSHLCDISVYYLPYPKTNADLTQRDLFAATTDELRRRRNIMYTDVCHRLGLVLDDLNDRLKMEVVGEKTKLARIYESSLADLPRDIKLFRAFNMAAFQSDALNEILDKLHEFTELDVNALRKNSVVRQEAWQKSIDLLNLLSKA